MATISSLLQEVAKASTSDARRAELSAQITALNKAARDASAERSARRIAMGYAAPWGRELPKNGHPCTPSHPKLGEAAAARLDFLSAAENSEYGVGVNRHYCRPLHPHGLRLVREGMMTLQRSGTNRCKHTRLFITPKGLIELARLRKRAK